MKNAFHIVRDFEHAVAEYTFAPYCVAVNSCTNALFLCLMWEKFNIVKNCLDLNINSELVQEVIIPKKTYIGVAQSIRNAGFQIGFNETKWSGLYRLPPFDIWDSAKLFTSGMYRRYTFEASNFVCTSHHWNKTLGIQQGGCILHNSKYADEWFRKARFDGRTEGIPASVDLEPIRGYHMYMSPEVAALGLVKLMHLPKDNAPMPMDDYPDLSQMEIFR